MSFRDDMRASKAIGSKDYDAAIEIYKKKLETDPVDPFALTSMAHCYEWKGDRETAMEYVNRQLAQYPNDFYMLLVAARYWSTKKDENETYRYACRILDNMPSEEPKDHSWVTYFIFKLLAILFKKQRNLPSRAKEGSANFRQHYKESIEWARQYKQWYEAKNASDHQE